jgi:hypothetical protein
MWNLDNIIYQFSIIAPPLRGVVPMAGPLRRIIELFYIGPFAGSLFSAMNNQL